MADWTDEALEQYTRCVLLDALRADWPDGAESGEAFEPSKRHQNEMREMVANPVSWERKKAEPLRRRLARRAAAVAAIAAVVFAAIRFLPEGEAPAVAQVPGGTPLILAALLVVLTAFLIWLYRKKK